MSFRRTKIVATLGPACDDPTVLTDMMEHINVARLNFSHGSYEEHLTRLQRVREINKEQGYNVAILADLQGPKIRLGDLKCDGIPIKPGDIVTLRTDIKEPVKGALPMQLETFARDVNPGEIILVDDGKITLQVIDTDKLHTTKLMVIYGEMLKSKKGVNLPMTEISVPSITEKDFKDTDFAIQHGAEWIALSFVRSAGDIITLKNYIRSKGGKARVIAKIEKPEALENIDSIIEVSDGVMVARGDMGVEIELEDVPIWQKRIVQKCNAAAKPVIVATQVLDSMEKNSRPTRAEANDVANAVLDGADAVMLSGETSVGLFPLLTVQTMSKIIAKVEAEGEHMDEHGIYYRNMKVAANDPHPLNANIIINACELAESVKARAIVGMTTSGYTASQISHCRPKAWIYIFTPDPLLLTTLNLMWGVKAFLYDGHRDTDKMIEEVDTFLKQKGLVQKGDVIINTASMPLHYHGLTNMIKIGVVK